MRVKKEIDDKNSRKALNQKTEDAEKEKGNASKWLGVLRSEAKLRKEREASEKEIKDAKRKAFLESDSDIEEEDLANIAGGDMFAYLDKVNLHLAAEERVINAWNKQDALKESDKKAK